MKLKLLRIASYLVMTPLTIIVVYLLMAVILTWIPANIFQQETNSDITIYVKSNGVHTDLVVPVNSEYHHWNTFIDSSLFQNPSAKYLSIGWGDKGFYLNTPEWSDLKLSTAFNAAFWLSSSAMHVSTTRTPVIGEKCKAISISKEQYKTLVDFIQNRFEKNKEGKIIPIHGHHYSGSDDYFFEAEGTYSFLYTCNCWSNEGLKVAGVKTALWAPFDTCIFFWR
jgi:uncharacterized protein (TIGR02117 family)